MEALRSASQALQRRLIKFLLKRLLGPYLRHELTLEQLDVTVRAANASRSPQ